MELDFSAVTKPEPARAESLPEKGNNLISFAEASSHFHKLREEELMNRVRSWGEKRKSS